MKNYLTQILSICFIVSLIFLISAKAFPQRIANENDTVSTNGTVASDSEESNYVSGVTSGRARSLIGGVIGLASLVLGWRAKNRSSAGHGDARTIAIVGLVLGLIGIVLSATHLITAAGAVFGSGSGKAGAIVGLVISLIGVLFARTAIKQKTKGN